MVSNRKKHALRKNGQANVTLKPFYHPKLVEAGCDEAGRGCLAGPVFAAAVILPKDFYHPSLTDSKMLSESKRNELRDVIENKALSWAVYSIDNEKIDEINILKASVMAMHKAIEKLNIKPGLLLIDGNHFIPYKSIKHHCIIKGDGKYLSIAAASILAKTYRDDYMCRLHEEFPGYCWNKNKGYATRKHRMAIRESGITRYHRKSFQLLDNQLMIPFPK